MSHLSDIGFPAKDREELLELLKRVYSSEKKEVIEIPIGAYIAYRDKSGAELWLQKTIDVNGVQQMVGVNPHYCGQSRRAVRITRREKRDDLDGAFSCWVFQLKETDQDFPMIFDVADYHRYSAIKAGQNVTVQISAFAERLEIRNIAEEEGEARKEDKKIMLADEAFLPIGQFLDPSNPNGSPTAEAVISGEILEIERKVNDFTGSEFYWVYLKTLSMEIDVVYDPKLLPETPEVGSIISGDFWVSGRIIQDSK